MASLSSVIDEIDIINEKLERMGGLLAKAREDLDYVQTRAGEQRNAPNLPATELLIAIKDEAAFANGFQRDHWVERIDAILKAAGGG